MAIDRVCICPYYRRMTFRIFTTKVKSVTDICFLSRKSLHRVLYEIYNVKLVSSSIASTRVKTARPIKVVSPGRSDINCLGFPVRPNSLVNHSADNKCSFSGEPSESSSLTGPIPLGALNSSISTGSTCRVNFFQKRKLSLIFGSN